MRHGTQRHESRSSQRATLSQLEAQPADLLVIGGGITGAGIARDAAMRGLRTVLVERHDLAWGTSSRSSRLVHGGLRYLEQRAFGLVLEANRERAILLKIAPHLVWSLPFVFPLHRGDRVTHWQLALGMLLYDILALFRNVRAHRMLGKRAVLEAEPMLRERGLLGGARYYDAQCDDARLVVANARSAVHHGALVANYMTVTHFQRESGRIAGAWVEDRLTGERGLIRAAAVVNATGPWSDAVRRLEDSGATPILRPTKGVHVVIDRVRLGHTDAITFLSPIDGRVMFALPWGNLSYLGTTDTDLPPGAATESPTATPEDVVYILRSVNARFPGARLTIDDVRATWAGLRPLLADGALPTSSRSREHAIVRGAGGMLSVVGGKLTTFRSMAAEVVDQVVAQLASEGRPKPPRAPTDREPLPGGEARDLQPFRKLGLELGVEPATVEHLLRHYGTEAAGIYNLATGHRALFRRLTPEHPAIEAEVVLAARRELAQTVEDVLVRRIHLFYETADRGCAAAPRVAALLGEELGWDSDRIAKETARYRAFVQDGLF